MNRNTADWRRGCWNIDMSWNCILAGRYFLKKTVHHKDGNRQNNAIDNLQLFASNHGPGQEVEDIVEWCVKMLERYPEFTSPTQRTRLRAVTETRRSLRGGEDEHQPGLPF
jgi:HNH endonuclease